MASVRRTIKPPSFGCRPRTTRYGADRDDHDRDVLCIDHERSVDRVDAAPIAGSGRAVQCLAVVVPCARKPAFSGKLGPHRSAIERRHPCSPTQPFTSSLCAVASRGASRVGEHTLVHVALASVDNGGLP